MIINNVPFVSNTPDDTHCLQAAYMSIAQYFDPTFNFSMDEWSYLTGYEEGLGTWANAGLVWFKENGYEVEHYENFDFEQFIEDPKGYMISVHGQEAGIWGFEHTNVPGEVERMKKLLNTNIIQSREPNLGDIKNGIDKGYLARVTINSEKLDNRVGYIGHAVVVFGYDDEFLYFHDPGLPAISNRKATVQDFEAAWSDQEKELDLIKRVN